MSNEGRRVLVVEDDHSIRELLQLHLGLAGFAVDDVGNGREALDRARDREYDLLVLDVMLPGLDGVSLCRAVRSGGPNVNTPILMLTARDSEADTVIGLESGADDYLTKPFGVGELLARIRVVLRRTSAMQAAQLPVIEFGDITVDMVYRRVYRAGTEVHLTPIEYQLLVALVRHQGRVVTQRQLLQEVWGPEYIDSPHYLRIYMQHLRHKLEADPARPRFLLTEPGVGYRLRDEG